MSDSPQIPFLVYGAPAIGTAEIDEVIDSLESGWLGTGPKVARFEEAICAYKECDHAVAVNSCTAALHLSLLAAGIGPGDEVITTPLTFCATVNAIIHTGATPVLADIDPITMNIDPVEVERRVTTRTRAIVPVHFAGRACAMDELMAIAARHELAVIEDAAHAIETTYRGRPAGTIGDFGCLSFYVTKNVCTGEGGMILTASDKHAARLKTLALHGLSRDAWRRFSDTGYRHYAVVEAGFKYNMMDLQAALGIHQLARVEHNWHVRRSHWTHYNDAMRSLPVTTPAAPDADSRHAHHLYTVLIDEQTTGLSRDDMLEAMQAARIGVGVHYLAVPEHPYYQERYGWRPEDWPNAMQIGRTTLSLPLSPALTVADIDRVVTAVTAAVNGASTLTTRRAA